jgi:hypothetical protein
MYTREQLHAWQSYTQQQQGHAHSTAQGFIDLLIGDFGLTLAQAKRVLGALQELDYK